MIILFNVIIFIVYVCDQIIEYQLELLGGDATACACSQQQEQWECFCSEWSLGWE